MTTSTDFIAPETIDKARYLRSQRLTWREIGDRLNCGAETLRRRIAEQDAERPAHPSKNAVQKILAGMGAYTLKPVTLPAVAFIGRPEPYQVGGHA